jgi:hypothetical protein
MNGCLIRIILITVVVIVVTSLLANNSDSAENIISKLKTYFEVLMKVIK